MWNKGWDEIFRSQAWGRYPPEEVVRFVARNFGRMNRANVALLEVGCGPGANLWYLAREGYRTYGIDGSMVAVEQARDRLSKEGLEAEILVGDALNLPFPDAMFDGALDVECIYANSFADSRKIIREIHRVLKPGGALFSKAFMTGSYGDGKGEKFGGEANTYLDLSAGTMKGSYGIIRFTSEEEIPSLYAPFEVAAVDHLVRSEGGRSHEIKEWLITCRKA